MRSLQVKHGDPIGLVHVIVQVSHQEVDGIAHVSGAVNDPDGFVDVRFIHPFDITEKHSVTRERPNLQSGRRPRGSLLRKADPQERCISATVCLVPKSNRYRM